MGESAQLKSANSSAEQWTKFAQLERNSPEIFEGEPQLHGFARKNIYCVLFSRSFETNNYFSR
jgi:hypothetical protein